MTRKSPFLRCLAGYVQYMRTEGRLAEESMKDYENAIRHCHDIVREGGGADDPLKMSAEDLRYLLEHMPPAVSTRKYYWAIFSGFLKWSGNQAVHQIKPKWPIVRRIYVDWLDPEEADRLRDFAISSDPLASLIVHLELDLCLRRVEITRLKLKDLHPDRIDVLGKGRFGGKPRTVSLVIGESNEIIGRYLEYRAQLESMTNGPQTDALVVYLRNHELHPYKRTSLDDLLERMQKESGIHFKGHHTLRRTGGRLMWLAGVPIETIASIMGHEATEMTLQYIGVNLGDQSNALEAVKNARIQRTKIAEIVPFVALPVK